MFSVYLITNLINQKKYVGSSIRVLKRWQSHKNSAFNSNAQSYNYPLQQAIRKYGLDNFKFEILMDDFNNLEEMQRYEYEMIIYYNSLAPNGYNQTLNTNQSLIAKKNLNEYLKKIKQKCAKIDYNNNIIETYSSYHEAARKNNLDPDNMATKIRAVCKGINSSINNILIFRDLDENNNIIEKPFKNYKGKKTIIAISIDNPENELYFESISEAAKNLKCDRASIQKCIQGSDRYSHVKGYILRELDKDNNIIETETTIEDRIIQYNNKNPIINGERHNIKDWCKIYNITTNSVYARIKKGMDVVEAITTPKRR